MKKHVDTATCCHTIKLLLNAGSNKCRGFEAHVLINAGSRLNAGAQNKCRDLLAKQGGQITSHTLVTS